jgi:protein phosphatase
VGVDDAFDLDVSDAIPVEPGDRYVVCSDGLYGSVQDPAIAEILAAAGDPLTACARLIDTANRAGGPDNISVGVAFFD